MPELPAMSGRNQRDQRSRHSYPLSSLFVLMAACGVVAALVAPVVRAVVADKLGLAEALAASLTGSLLLMALCGVLGLYHYRPLRGVLWGLTTGGVTGLLIGPVVLAPVRSFGSQLLTSLIGAVVLVAIGAALNWSSKRRP